VRCAVILSDLTYPTSQGLHEQAVELLRYIGEICDEVVVYIYCKDVATLDESALALALPDTVAITVVPYSGSALRRGLTNRIFGRARPTEKKIAAEITAFNPDFVHLDMAVAAGLHRLFKNTPGVISWVDPGSRRQFRFGRSARGTERLPHFAAGLASYLFELSCRSRNKTWHVVSPTDRDFLQRLHRGQRVVQIPVALTSSSNPATSTFRDESSSRDSPVTALVFLDLRVPHLYASFEWLVSECLRPLNAAETEVRYKVLGRVPMSGELDDLSAGLSVEYLMWVDDLPGALSGVDFVILPDQVGTGLKSRAIQALAAGCAVIGTPYAFEGIELESGTHAIVASSAEEWRQGIGRLATDSQTRARLRRFSSDAVRPFEAAAVFERWNALYADIAAPSPVAARRDPGN